MSQKIGNSCISTERSWCYLDFYETYLNVGAGPI